MPITSAEPASEYLDDLRGTYHSTIQNAANPASCLKTAFDVYIEARIEQYYLSLSYDSERLADAWRAFAVNGEWGRATWLLASPLDFDRISVGPAFLLSIGIFANTGQSLLRAESAYAEWLGSLSYHERVRLPLWLQ